MQKSCKRISEASTSSTLTWKRARTSPVDGRRSSPPVRPRDEPLGVEDRAGRTGHHTEHPELRDVVGVKHGRPRESVHDDALAKARSTSSRNCRTDSNSAAGGWKPGEPHPPVRRLGVVGAR